MLIDLHSGKLNATVDTHGGELVSLKDDSGFEYIWQGDPSVWKGKNPNLFPIVGKLKENKIRIGDKVCEMPQHGLARQREFSVKDKSAGFVEFELNQDASTLMNYPFSFSFRVRHTLFFDGFETEFFVENKSNEEMPFCVGAHTGFNCPLEPGKTLEDYMLRFDKEEDTGTISFNIAGEIVPEVKKIPFKSDRWPLKYSDFDTEDTLIFEGLKSSQVTLEPKNGGRGINVEFTSWPMIAFWTKPMAHAPYICIEPWQGCAVCEGESGEFKDKRHVVTLAPGSTWERGFKVTLC